MAGTRMLAQPQSTPLMMMQQGAMNQARPIMMMPPQQQQQFQQRQQMPTFQQQRPQHLPTSQNQSNAPQMGYMICMVPEEAGKAFQSGAISAEALTASAIPADAMQAGRMPVIPQQSALQSPAYWAASASMGNNAGRPEFGQAAPVLAWEQPHGRADRDPNWRSSAGGMAQISNADADENWRATARVLAAAQATTYYLDLKTTFHIPSSKTGPVPEETPAVAAVLGGA